MKRVDIRQGNWSNIIYRIGDRSTVAVHESVKTGVERLVEDLVLFPLLGHATGWLP